MLPRLEDQFDEAWIVTKTKVTTEAAAYAECVGIPVLAWHYPEEKLESLIERYGSYPVTALLIVTENQTRALLARRIATLDDLSKPSTRELKEVTKMGMLLRKTNIFFGG